MTHWLATSAFDVVRYVDPSWPRDADAVDPWRGWKPGKPATQLASQHKDDMTCLAFTCHEASILKGHTHPNVSCKLGESHTKTSPTLHLSQSWIHQNKTRWWIFVHLPSPLKKKIYIYIYTEYLFWEFQTVW